MPHAVLRHTLAPAAALSLLGACGGPEAVAAPLEPDPVPDLGSQVTSLTSGGVGETWVAVVVNTLLDGATTATFTVRADRVAPAASRQPQALASPGEPAGAAAIDRGFEGRLRETERRDLSPRIAGAQAWFRGRTTTGVRAQAIPDGARIGDLVRVNVQADSACTNAVYHAARVVAVSRRALVLEDTLNPRGGFTAADYDRFAARFDSLVYPLDSAAFGAPTDIDHNGRVALVVTRAVNEETAHDAPAYVAGFTFSRDLFPIAGGARTQPCAGSNEGEYFYLLAPDPSGTINANPRSRAFVDSASTAVIAHELQHLINAGRRLYVNGAPKFEERWLDEGLAHVAEELLFYREAGLAPAHDLGIDELRATSATLAAWNRDMAGNEARYREYLASPSTSSPVAPRDDLATRGATWSLLRYLSDRSAGGDADVLFRLANSRTAGVENLVGVFGGAVASEMRDWNVSHAADDVDSTARFQQPSWNWHSIYSSLFAGAPYPLQVQAMATGTTYPGTVLGGGAAYYQVRVPANSTATVSLIEQPRATSTLSLVMVRTR